ncbi:MAG: tRNA (adenosine(37)-N6)-threonylcarbamoyltransferase complex transferase subunit TsaD [Ignavibacteria bacterium]|nr:tRNA (adenosine(37)-N6)-threonylcarbamoyltransferase complex transferase subunit TsaD [Ignavibacteria bacterium]
MTILGIETSCDETSAAVLINGRMKSNVISSQFVHSKYGGVVPELASRAHIQLIVPVVESALSKANISKYELEGIAVTFGPGLMGALLVGVNFAKSLSYGLRIPFIGVNHLEAHIYSNLLSVRNPAYPFLCLIVSGGHTILVLVEKPLQHHILGETLDDAAGEAFDKVAKMLNLGYPGGHAIENAAKEGNPNAIQFPRAMMNEDSFDFSFSGLKTAVLYYLRDNHFLTNGTLESLSEKERADICASFQIAVIDVLTMKLLTAARKFNVCSIAIAGGVSANSELRSRLKSLCKSNSLQFHIPELQFCTDNGAMIAKVGEMKLQRGIHSEFDLVPVPNLRISQEKQ